MSATSTDAKREGRQLRGSRGAQRIQEVMLSTADSDGRVRKTGRHVNFNVTRTVDRQSGVLCGVGDGVSTRAGVTSNDSAAAKCNPMRVNQAAPSCESRVNGIRRLISIIHICTIMQPCTRSKS